MQSRKLTCLECGQINRIADGKVTEKAKCGTCGAALAPNKAVEIDLQTLRKAARNDDLPLVADFWAPWCGPCRMMAPEFSKAATLMKGQARLVKLNTETHPKAGTAFGIRGIPTVLGFKAGREKARKAGAMRATEIVDWVRSNL